MDGWSDGEAVVAQPLSTTVRYSTPQFWVRNFRLSMERSERKEKKRKKGRSLTGTRVRDKIMVRCIAKMLVEMVHLRNMTLMGSLFPLVVVSFEEI